MDALGKTLRCLATLALAALASLPLPARAHAVLERSQPGAGAVLAEDAPPGRVSLWFTESVEADPRAVAVLDASQHRVDKADAHVARDEPARVDVSLADMPRGNYVVRWRVTSADGHIVRGAQWFAVGEGTGPPPLGELSEAGAARLQPVEIAARWLGLAALMLLAGVPLFRALVLEPAGIQPRPNGELLWLATAALVISQGLRVAVQTQLMSESVPGLPGEDPDAAFFASRFAVVLWIQFVLAVGTGAWLYSSWASKARWRISAALVLLLVIATSAGGHAAGARWFPAASIGIDVVHLASAALWIGGLAELLLLLPSLAAPARRETLAALVPRVSRVFLVTVLVLVASGVYGTWLHVGDPAALTGTAYGQALLLKLAVLALMLLAAATNLLYFRPRIIAGAPAAPRRFRYSVSVEAGAAIVLLLAAALLTTLPPPAQQPPLVKFEASRDAADLRVSLEVDPAWPGISRYRVRLAQADGSAPQTRGVTLAFRMEGMEAGETHVLLEAEGAGAYGARGFYIGTPGMANVRVAVSRPDLPDAMARFRVEVPDVDASRSAGLAELLAHDDARALPSAAQGRRLYEANCAQCHRPADLAARARWHPDAQLEWLIENGLPGTSMEGFGKRLDAGQIRDIVAHLRSLDRGGAAPRRKP